MKKALVAYKWELIIILWFAMFFHQGDRQLFNVLLPLIKDSLELTDKQSGLVVSILIATYAVMVPIAGYIGDRVSRKRVILISLICWSTATLFTGSSTLLIHLILLKGIGAGGGEAFYAPSAFSMIGKYHKKTRSFAMSIHQTALYVGIIVSGVLGAYIGEQFGWRYAFYIFGGFGIILAIIVFFRLKDPEKQVLDVKDQKENIPFTKALTIIFTRPTAILLTLAFAGMVYVNVGYLTWMPTFLFEDFNLSLTNAGFSSTFYHHVFAFAGVLIGGKLSDYLAKNNAKSRLFIQAAGLILGAPFIYLMSQGSELFMVYLGLGLFGLFRGIYDSNIFPSLYEVIPSKYHSSASGIMLLFAFGSGSFAPFILSVFKSNMGLKEGFASLAFVYVFAGLCILLAAWLFYNKDHQKKKKEESNDTSSK